MGVGGGPEPTKPQPPPRLGSCGRFLKCCRRRFCCCCQRKLRKAEAFSNNVDSEGVVRVGSRVKLFGLTQAHYNGLVGTVVDGPNEKGRFEVDLVVVDNDTLREHQTLSFK